jgi:hypothetical protein
VSTNSGDWKIKGFIDVDHNIYTISVDSKIISKIIEVQLFPLLKRFADENGYEIVLAEKQNWYPDMSFVNKSDQSIKYAVDIKTTYRLPERPGYCNGFTLGSHGKYFQERDSTKNVQFPYGEYSEHITLGVLYTRIVDVDIDETEILSIDNLELIQSVIGELQFFVQEKWKIAGEKGGSGNTRNIGSISFIEDIVSGNGMFAKLGEDVFDLYWMNYDQQIIQDPKDRRKSKKMRSLSDFASAYKIDPNLITPKR